MNNIMFKIINEESKKNSREILKWSKKFVSDLLNDPEIKELSKLPDNEYGEKAIDAGVGENMAGFTTIWFDAWGNGGEFRIDGFDENGKPYFDSVDGYGKDSYEKVLEDIKNEMKDSIESTKKYNKEREERLAKAKEDFDKMSQEEKDKIVMSYLINRK